MKRAANSQKCIRAGGKHNDLDDVGKDTYHHTFFEMLGNWSFGDYFKEEAISWAWELLTVVYGLEKDRLYATYFEGSAKDGLVADLEAREIWLRFLPEDHVLPGNAKDNFWEMGETGPCGPCSEIHYDRLGGRNAANLVNYDDPNVIEIWNNVFIQFNREANGSLSTLPAKHVDTGMGFERITSILQRKLSNYDTDIFMPIFHKITEITAAPAYQGRVGDADVDNVDMAYRVVADHIRTLSFAIADGAVPSNEGRGYILRRVLRRAVRYARQIFNAKPGFFAELVDTVADVMGDVFPEVRQHKATINAIILDEERSFGRTLQRGIERFTRLAANMKPGSVLDTNDVYDLYSTFGFPIDLTELMAYERKLAVDRKAFDAKLKEEQDRNRELERLRRLGVHAEIVLDANAIAKIRKEISQNVTDDLAKYSSEATESALPARLIAVYDGKSFHQSAEQGRFGLLFDRTSFYAESGGQISDQGKVSNDDGSELFFVEDAQVFGGFVLHVGHVQPGASLQVGSTYGLSVNRERRQPLMKNHTSTHLLNLALRERLGANVDQKGSRVAETSFTFDFSYSKPLTAEDLAVVDAHVGKAISSDLVVYTKEVPLEQAKRIQSIRAVFGEIYPDPVRVVSVGVDVDTLLADPANPKWANYSIEFCGGTHLQRSSEALSFAVIKEATVGAGVRRITAVTGMQAFTAHKNASLLQAELASVRAAPAEQRSAAIAELLEQLSVNSEKLVPASAAAEIRSELQAIQTELKRGAAADKNQAKQNAVQFAKQHVEQLPEGAIFTGSIQNVGANSQALSEAAKVFSDSGRAALLIGFDEKKIAVSASVPQALIARGLKANEWASAASVAAGGKGGGRENTAAGSGEAAQLQQALDAAAAHAAKFK